MVAPPAASLPRARSTPMPVPAKVKDWLTPPLVTVATVLPPDTVSVNVAPADWMAARSTTSPPPKPEMVDDTP